MDDQDCLQGRRELEGSMLVSREAWPTRRFVLAGLITGPFLGLPAGRPEAAELGTVPSNPPPPIRFDVIRQGDVIGSHQVDFTPGAGNYAVHTHIDATVQLLGVTVFAYKHEGTEVWSDGRLVQFDSETIDDKSQFFVHGKAAGGDFQLTNRKGSETAPADIMVASYWTPEIARRTLLIDPQRGRLKTQQMLGKDTVSIPLPTGPVRAARYQVTGITEGWVAYDGGRWIAAELRKKGSDIFYRLKS